MKKVSIAEVRTLLPSLTEEDNTPISALAFRIVAPALSYHALKKELITDILDTKSTKRDNNGRRLRILSLDAEHFNLEVFYNKKQWWTKLTWAADFSQEGRPITSMPKKPKTPQKKK